MSFSSITPKILIFEYYAKNKTCSEFNFICVYQIWAKLIEKWPSKIQDGRHEIQHQAAVISRASSSSPCSFYFLN